MITFIRQLAVVLVFCGWGGAAYANAAPGSYSADLSFLAKRFSLPETPTDGAYDASYSALENTPEGDWMIRFGDIDNFGQVWSVGHDPFSGRLLSALGVDYLPPKSTTHAPQDQVANADIAEGEAQTAARGSQPLEPFIISGRPGENGDTLFSVETEIPFSGDISSPVMIQLYLATTGQAADSGNKWSVRFNGQALEMLNEALGKASMRTGQGYLITWQVLPVPGQTIDRLSFDLAADSEEVFGYGVDFVKFVAGFESHRNAVDLGVIVLINGKPAKDVEVIAQGVQGKTDQAGEYRFAGLARGFTPVSVYRPGFGHSIKWIHLNEPMTRELKFNL